MRSEENSSDGTPLENSFTQNTKMAADFNFNFIVQKLQPRKTFVISVRFICLKVSATSQKKKKLKILVLRELHC